MKDEQPEEIFDEFTLTTEEMICIKGGEADADPVFKPTPPIVRI